MNMSFRSKAAIITALLSLFTTPMFASETCAVTFVNPVLSRIETTLNAFAPGAKFAQGSYMIRGYSSLMNQETDEVVFADVAFTVSVHDNTLTFDRQVFIRSAVDTEISVAADLMDLVMPGILRIQQPGETVLTEPGDTGSPYSVRTRSRFFVRSFSTMSDQDTEAVSDAISAFIIAHMEKPVRSQRN